MSVRQRMPIFLGAAASIFAAMVVLSSAAEARLTRITTSSVSVVDFPSFGATGPY